MLYPAPADYCYLPGQSKAKLVVVIDTEEEFDWSRDFSRSNVSVKSMRNIGRVQSLFDRYGITPVYVVDYPIVASRDGYKILQEIHASKRCLIGAHVHPWVNPPYEETVSRRNSFPGNLSRHLEAEKLRILSECISERFEVQPKLYKAGRYGVGVHTAEILMEQDYEVDLSVCPFMNYSSEDGPDFSHSCFNPYWISRKRLLELPLTIGFSGVLHRWGAPLHRLASSKVLRSCRTVGLLARLGLVDKVWLSPEGFDSREHRRLTKALYRDGLRVFTFAFHSPSVEPGHTPYVRSQRDLDSFLSRCEQFFDFFMGTLGGCPTTPLELKREFSLLTT